MCKPGYHFKLCTCSIDEIDDENFWRLWRIDTEESEEITNVGDIAPPQDHFENTTIIYLKNKILEDLNQHNVFDFEYAPIDGDNLEITLDGQEICFQYEGGKFVEADEEEEEEEEEYYHFTRQKWVAAGRIDVS